MPSLLSWWEYFPDFQCFSYDKISGFPAKCAAIQVALQNEKKLLDWCTSCFNQISFFFAIHPRKQTAGHQTFPNCWKEVPFPNHHILGSPGGSFRECRFSYWFFMKEIFSKSPVASHRILTTSIWTRPRPVENIFGWQVFMGGKFRGEMGKTIVRW